MKPRISMITLGVRDLQKSIRFYEQGLGFPRMESSPEVAFFTLNGTWLGLYGRDALAADATVSSDGSGFESFALAHNVHEEARRCNCSMCRRRGAIAASVVLEGLEVTRGADKLSMYQFNTRTAEHYFCSVCGIYTHHKRRSNRGQYGFNVACLDGVNPFDLGEVSVVDGVNHPCDR